MIDFFVLIANFFKSIFNLLNTTIINGGSGGQFTSLGGLIFVLIVLGFIVNVFWKGARA